MESIEYDILLATYNGENYIVQLLNSIICQLDKGRILIHDDGSEDSTLKILEDYARNNDKIILLQAPPQGNAKDNFAYLMSKAEAKYIFFADQDDIWHSNKIKQMLKVIKFYEKIFGEDFPLLVHSDLQVIDKKDVILSESLWRYQNLDPSWSCELSKIVTQNVVTGCAMIINKELKELSLPIPKEAIMHDWWLAIIANLYGKVVYIDEALVDYRKHDNNVVGAKKFNLSYIVNKLSDINSISISQFETVAQVGALLNLENIDIRNTDILKKYYYLPRYSKIKRVKVINKYGFKKIGVFREAAWLWLV